MSRRHLIICILPILASAFISAESAVTFTAPRLKPGMASLEGMLQSSAGEFSGDIEDIVANALRKPEFMQGFSGAAANTVLIPSAIQEKGHYSLYLGSSASIYSKDLSPSLATHIRSLNAESDEKLGACVQPLVIRASVPLDRLFRGLFVGGNIGYMDAEAGDYGVWAFSGGLSLGYTLIKPKKGVIAWNGISFLAGGDYAKNRITAVIKPGTISQEIPLDPDGEGPLVPINVTLRLNPIIKGGVESTLTSFSLAGSTGVTFLESISLFAGGGFSVARAQTGISIEADSQIQVEGYLSDLVVQQGKIAIKGTTEAEKSIVLGGFAQVGIQFNVGAFNITLPVIWKPRESLGTGVFMGVSF